MKLRNLLFIVLAAIVFCNCQSYQPTSLTVASYNLRNANVSDSARGDGWGQRYPVIAQIVQYHDFDIFGTQECFLHQLKDMKEALPGYDYIGVGRDDGKDKGEHSAIFYRTDKFDIVEKGDFWLSETPDVPSKGWDAVLPAGVISNAKIPVSSFCSSISTWTTSARKPVWRALSSYRKR